MNNLFFKIFFCFSILKVSFLFAGIKQVPAIDKPSFGLNYDISMKPYVDKMLYRFSESELNSLQRGSLYFLYPYNRYFSLGASLDFTRIESKYNRDPNLDLTKNESKIAPIFLGFSALIRPQVPLFISSNFEILLFQENQLGLSSVSPITFGTQPITERYVFLGTSNIPTPFPIMFETTPKIGLQIFGWSFVGFDVAFGYRMLWIIQPLVNSGRANNEQKDDRKAIYYDVTSPFIQAGLKFAF